MLQRQFENPHTQHRLAGARRDAIHRCTCSRAALPSVALRIDDRRISVSRKLPKWRTRPTINQDQVTIASLLKENGYQTAMVGKWHLGFDESQGYERPLPGGPIDVGFESFFGIRASTDIPPYFYIRGERLSLRPSTRSRPTTRRAGPIQGAFWREGGIAPGPGTERCPAEIHRRSDRCDPKIRSFRKIKTVDAVPGLPRSPHALVAVRRIHWQEQSQHVWRFCGDGRRDDR